MRVLVLGFAEAIVDYCGVRFVCLLICPGKIRGQQLSTRRPTVCGSCSSCCCCWSPSEWQLLLFSWLDKYKLWEFNSHQRLVLVRIYIHTHTHTQTRHTHLQSVLLFVSMATFCGLLQFVEFCFDLFVVIGDFCILLFPLRCSLKSSQFIHFQCDVIGI